MSTSSFLFQHFPIKLLSFITSTPSSLVIKKNVEYFSGHIFLFPVCTREYFRLLKRKVIKTNNQQHKWICYALQNLRYENTLFQLNPKTSKRRTTLKNQPAYCVILGFVKDTQILRVSFQVIRSDRRKIAAIFTERSNRSGC